MHEDMEEKVFVIFNTEGIGDVLVTNTLVQNIKLYFPSSRIMFVCNKETEDFAKYQAGVSGVIIAGKEKINTPKGIFDFIKNFPNKKPFASFVTHSNEKQLLISRLIGSKHVISHHKFFLWNTDEKYDMRSYNHIKDILGSLIEPLTNEHKNLPVKYIPPEINNALTEGIKKLEKPVVLSVTSRHAQNNMTVDDCKELIVLLKMNGYTPVFTGKGNIPKQFVIQLKQAGCIDFIDIVDCTSAVELANIIKNSQGCICVDNGILHLANALDIPVTEVFYSGLASSRGSDTNLYPARILNQSDEEKITPQDIIREFNELMCVNAEQFQA